MKKPVSLAPAGGSLKDPLAAAGQTAAKKAAAAPSPAIAPAIAVAAQVAGATVDPPLPTAVSTTATAVWDFWSKQADAYWQHGLTLAQAGSLSAMVEAQGHFVRQQVEMAREQATLWSSLMNQTTGLSPVDHLPALTVWAPWPVKPPKSGA